MPDKNLDTATAGYTTVNLGAVVFVVLEFDRESAQDVSTSANEGDRRIKFDGRVDIKGPNLPPNLVASLDVQTREELVEKAKSHWNSVNAREDMEIRLDQTRMIMEGLEEIGQPSDAVLVRYSKTESDVELARNAENRAFEALYDVVQRIKEQAPTAEQSAIHSTVTPQRSSLPKSPGGVDPLQLSTPSKKSVRFGGEQNVLMDTTSAPQDATSSHQAEEPKGEHQPTEESNTSYEARDDEFLKMMGHDSNPDGTAFTRKLMKIVLDAKDDAIRQGDSLCRIEIGPGKKPLTWRVGGKIAPVKLKRALAEKVAIEKASEQEGE